MFFGKTIYILSQNIYSFRNPLRVTVIKSPKTLVGQGFPHISRPLKNAIFWQPPYIHGYFQALTGPSETINYPQKVRKNTYFQALPLEYRGQNHPLLNFVGMKADLRTLRTG